MNFIESLLALFIPKAHHFTCGFCNKPIHPWEDVCPFCGKGINWREDQKMKKPDWYSRIFERHTSYARWLKARTLTLKDDIENLISYASNNDQMDDEEFKHLDQIRARMKELGLYED